MHRRALLLILRRLGWAALALLALLLPLGAAAQSGCTALWATVDNDGPGGGTTQSLRYFNSTANRWDNLSPQVNLTGNANALAGNPINGLLYYVDRSASVGDLYSFNINSRANSLVGRIPVTNGPPAGNIIGATFDAAGRLFIYGTNGGNEYLAEVNTTPATTLTLTIPWTTVTLVGTGANPALGGSGDIYVDQSGNGFIASNTVPNSIWSLNLTAGANFGRVAQVLTLSPGSATSLAGVAVDPITGATYVSTGNAGSVTYLVNTTTGATTLLDNTTSYTVSDMGNCVNSPAAPSLTKSFSTAYQSGSSGTATVLLTVGNPNIVPIWLTSNLVDMLPSGMTVYTTPALAGSCTTVSGNSVTATAGAGNVTFASGGSIPAGGCTLSFVVSAGVALGDYVNTLPAGSLTTSAGNNATAASATFKVGTDFSASKTQGLGTAGPYGAGSLTVPGGSTMQYVLTITNSASGGTGSASFTDTLPELVAPVLGISAAMTGGGSCTTATAVVGGQTQITGTVNNAPPGAVCTVTVTAQVSGTQTSAVSFINTLTLAPLSGTGDANASNNVATVSTSITPEADLRVTKLSSAASGETGGTLSYAIVLQNAGPSLAGNVTVTDVLPAGLTLVGASVSPSGSLTLVTSTAGVTATAPWLGVGSTTVTVVVSLSNLGSADAVVTNTASATSTTPDPTPTNNTGTVSTTLTPRADLVMVKSGPASAPAGGTFGYVITVANAGPSAAANVTVTDVLPAGLVLLSASSTSGSVSSDAAGVTLTIPSLSAATTVTVSLTVQVN